MNGDRRRDTFEAIGLLVVVASLLVLIFEIRQNTDALFAQSRHAIMESALQELFLQFDNPDIAQSIAKDDSLTEVEQIRLDAFLTSSLRSREFAWLQYQGGAIDEDQYDTELAVIAVIFDASRNRRWWDQLGRQYFSKDFANFVDETLESREATDTLWQKVPVWDGE